MKQISAIDAYMAKVYKWIMILVMVSVTAGGFDFVGMKLLGFYPTVGWVPLIIFVGTNIIYDVIGAKLIRSATRDGVVSPKMMFYGKVYMTILLIVQFNFILYMIPSKEYWAFIFYFALVEAFFLDYKLITILIGALCSSIVVGSIIKPEILPEKDQLFVPEMALRFCIIVLSFFGVYLFTKFVGKHLADAKRDELEKNNNITN